MNYNYSICYMLYEDDVEGFKMNVHYRSSVKIITEEQYSHMRQIIASRNEVKLNDFVITSMFFLGIEE